MTGRTRGGGSGKQIIIFIQWTKSGNLTPTAYRKRVLLNVPLETATSSRHWNMMLMYMYYVSLLATPVNTCKLLPSMRGKTQYIFSYSYGTEALVFKFDNGYG